jgi:acyl dehydratase
MAAARLDEQKNNRNKQQLRSTLMCIRARAECKSAGMAAPLDRAVSVALACPDKLTIGEDRWSRSQRKSERIAIAKATAAISRIFAEGDIYEHRPGRTISEADNTWFTLLTMNQHPLHFDAAYASKSEFGKPLVNSCLTLSIVAGMSVSDISQKAIGNLGWNDIRLIAPVFVGDTIYAESEVLSKRESAKRPTQGIVTVKTTGKKADGTVFMTYERSVLVPKRGHAVDDRADY